MLLLTVHKAKFSEEYYKLEIQPHTLLSTKWKWMHVHRKQNHGDLQIFFQQNCSKLFRHSFALCISKTLQKENARATQVIRPECTLWNSYLTRRKSIRRESRKWRRNARHCRILCTEEGLSHFLSKETDKVGPVWFLIMPFSAKKNGTWE